MFHVSSFPYAKSISLVSSLSSQSLPFCPLVVSSQWISILVPIILPHFSISSSMSPLSTSSPSYGTPRATPFSIPFSISPSSYHSPTSTVSCYLVPSIYLQTLSIIVGPNIVTDNNSPSSSSPINLPLNNTLFVLSLLPFVNVSPNTFLSHIFP